MSSSSASVAPPVDENAVRGDQPDNMLLVPAPQRGVFRRLLRPDLLEKAVGVGDFILIGAVCLATGLGYRWLSDGTFNWGLFVAFGALIAGNFSAAMRVKGNYQLKTLTMLGKQIRDTFVVWSAMYGVLAVLGFTLKISGDFSRGAVILLFFTGGSALIISRFCIAAFVSRALDNSWFAVQNILVIAEKGRTATSTSLVELKRHGLRPARVFEVSKLELEALGICKTLRAKLSDVVATAQSSKITDIYLLIGWHNRRAIEGIVSMLTVLPVSIHLVPDESTERFLSTPIMNVGRTWTAELAREPLTAPEQLSKRFLDLVLASIAIILLCPLLILTAVLIKLDSTGSVLFRQKRNGFSGHAFGIYKFRTMYVLEDGPQVRQTRRNDPRVTRLGRWLRRSSIDELPQLFNVLKGEMSLVGPRPHAAAHNSEYEQLIANYAFRHHVKPGITGWAQVEGFRGETQTLDLMQKRVEHDLWYINNWSFGLDIKILIKTILVSLNSKSAY